MNRWPIHALALVLLTVAAYANSLHGQFVFDDVAVVLQNPALMNIKTLGDAVSPAAEWRGLLLATYGLNYYWGGLDTPGYHAVNLFLHVVNVLLVYALIAGAAGKSADARFAALAGAAVFSVHPIFSGAVSYIAARSSILCATFYFLAILLFLKALDATRAPMRLLYLALTGAAALLAFQAKQEAIALPLFLAAVLFLRVGEKSWRWILPLSAAPLLAVVLMKDRVAALLEEMSTNRILASGGLEPVLAPGPYFRTYLTAVVDYVFPRFVVPVGLSADPHITPVAHWYSPRFIGSVLLLAGLAWLALRVRRRQPLLSLGLSALLVSPLLAYALTPLADVVFEYRAYIPGLGVAAIFGWAFQWIGSRYPGKRWIALGVVLTLFGVLTLGRNRVFADAISLWEDAEKKSSGKPRPHLNLGQAYQQAGRADEAIREYEHALALKPDLHAAYANLGAIYVDRNELDRAEAMLTRVTALAPRFQEGFVNLAVLHLRRKDPDRALQALDRAFELPGESFALYFNKGEALTSKGRLRRGPGKLQGSRSPEAGYRAASAGSRQRLCPRGRSLASAAPARRSHRAFERRAATGAGLRNRDPESRHGIRDERRRSDGESDARGLRRETRDVGLGPGSRGAPAAGNAAP